MPLTSAFPDKSNEVAVAFQYSAPADQSFYVAPARCRVISIRAVPNVVGSDAGAVTGAVKKCTGTQAPSAGTAVHAGSIDLKGTVNAVVTPAVASAAATLSAGDRLAFDGTGVMTAATGCIVVALRYL